MVLKVAVVMMVAVAVVVIRRPFDVAKHCMDESDECEYSEAVECNLWL